MEINKIRSFNLDTIITKLREFEKAKLNESKSNVYLEEFEKKDNQEYNVDFVRFEKSFIAIKLFEKVNITDGSYPGMNDSDIDINMTHNQNLVKPVRTRQSGNKLKSIDNKIDKTDKGDKNEDSVFDYGTNNITNMPSVYPGKLESSHMEERFEGS